MTTQADYDAITEAINSGQLRVRHGDRDVTFRSIDQMMRVKNMMARELGIAKGPNRVYATFDRGLAK